jgi:hypothetical protein
MRMDTDRVPVSEPRLGSYFDRFLFEIRQEFVDPSDLTRRDLRLYP